MKIIVVGMDDGIILDTNRCVILDESKLTINEKTLLDTGTEMEALTIAERHGIPLRHILQGCGYGDLHYGNCVPFSPATLREEFTELPSLFPEVFDIKLTDVMNSSIADDIKEMGDVLKWGASLSNEELHMIAQHAIQDDELWSQWRATIIESLLEYKNTVTESEQV